MNKEIEIPEGYEARIEGNKVILEPKESEYERIRKVLLRCCYDWDSGRSSCVAIGDVPAIRAYLEKQKEQKYTNSEKPKEWMDGKRIRKDIIALIKFALKDGSAVAPGSRTTKEEALSYLEKQKDEAQRQFNLGVQAGKEEVMYEMEKEQKSAEWSEEDDALLKEIVSFFRDGTVKLQHDIDLYAGFLEKKYKSLRPLPHWKPSEEQIIALARATNRCVGVDDAKILIKLLEQLESL